MCRFCAGFCGHTWVEGCKVALMSTLYGQEQMIIAGEVSGTG